MGKKAKTRISFVVSFDLPEGATISEARQYVDNAVVCWGGGTDPDGPFIHMSDMGVKVSLFKRVTEYR